MDLRRNFSSDLCRIWFYWDPHRQPIAFSNHSTWLQFLNPVFGTLCMLMWTKYATCLFFISLISPPPPSPLFSCFFSFTLCCRPFFALPKLQGLIFASVCPVNDWGYFYVTLIRLTTSYKWQLCSSYFWVPLYPCCTTIEHSMWYRACQQDCHKHCKAKHPIQVYSSHWLDKLPPASVCEKTATTKRDPRGKWWPFLVLLSSS